MCTILKFLFRIQRIRFFHENNFVSDRAQNDLNQNWREVIFCSNGDIKIASNCHDLKYCIQRVCFESYLECVNQYRYILVGRHEIEGLLMYSFAEILRFSNCV